MSARTASTLVIGILAALACLFTTYLVLVPVWILFIGWASFFTAGTGASGLGRSLAMNIIGALVAALALWVIISSGGNAWVVAISVGVGAALLVALGAVDALSATPAGFLGFAATFGLFAVAGADLFAPFDFQHPLVLVIVALIIGGLFGLVSGVVGAALTAKKPAAAPAVSNA